MINDNEDFIQGLNANHGNSYQNNSSIGSIGLAEIQSVAADYKLFPSTLFNYLNPWWIPAPWLQYLSIIIAKAVQEGKETGKKQGILVSAPPRHGKSKFLTTAVPIWILELFQSHKIAICTYGDDLSKDFTGEIRDTIDQNSDKLSVRLRKDATSISNWKTTAGGGVYGTGIGGPLTGKGYQVILIDDYIKNYEDAMSSSKREKIWQWYLSVARTRLEPGGVICIVATRWVKDDLHGKIISAQSKRSGNFYKLYNFPALAVDDPDEPDLLGRKPGEPLFPQRYTADDLQDLRAELGTHIFNAMFQGRPDDDDAKIADKKWFRGITRNDFFKLYEAEPAEFKVARSMDFASQANKGDYSVSVKGFYHNKTKKLYITLPKRGQWNELRVMNEFDIMHTQEPLDVPFILEQEPGSSGKLSVAFFAKEALGRKILPSPATSSKLLRASFVLAAAERGDVFVICDTQEEADKCWDSDFCKPWADFMSEWDNFPEDKHDDQVDGLAILYNYLADKKPSGATFGRGPNKDSPKGENVEKRANGIHTGLTFGRASNNSMRQLRDMGLI